MRSPRYKQQSRGMRTLKADCERLTSQRKMSWLERLMSRKPKESPCICATMLSRLHWCATHLLENRCCAGDVRNLMSCWSPHLTQQGQPKSFKGDNLPRSTLTRLEHTPGQGHFFPPPCLSIQALTCTMQAFTAD